MITFFLCLFLFVSTLTVGLIGLRVFMLMAVELGRLPPDYFD